LTNFLTIYIAHGFSALAAIKPQWYSVHSCINYTLSTEFKPYRGRGISTKICYIIARPCSCDERASKRLIDTRQVWPCKNDQNQPYFCL